MSEAVDRMNALLESMGSHHRVVPEQTQVGETLAEISTLLVGRILLLEQRLAKLERPHGAG